MEEPSFDNILYFPDEGSWRAGKVRNVRTLVVGRDALVLRGGHDADEVTLSPVRSMSIVTKGRLEEPAIEVEHGTGARAFIASAKILGDQRKRLEEAAARIAERQPGVEIRPTRTFDGVKYLPDEATLLDRKARGMATRTDWTLRIEHDALRLHSQSGLDLVLDDIRSISIVTVKAGQASTSLELIHGPERARVFLATPTRAPREALQRIVAAIREVQPHVEVEAERTIVPGKAAPRVPVPQEGSAFEKVWYFPNQTTWLDRKARGTATQTHWTLTVGDEAIRLDTKGGLHVVITDVRQVQVVTAKAGSASPAIAVTHGPDEAISYLANGKITGTPRKMLDAIVAAILEVQPAVELREEQEPTVVGPHGTGIGPEAEEIIRRLVETPREGPVDRTRIEQALFRYFRALDTLPRPVRWIEGPWPERSADGFVAAWSIRAAGKSVGPTAAEETEPIQAADRSTDALGKAVRKAGQVAGTAGLKGLEDRLSVVVPLLERARTQDPSVAPAKGASKDSAALVGAALGGFLGAMVASMVTPQSTTPQQHAWSALAGSRGVFAADYAARKWALEGAGLSAAAVDRMLEVNLPFVEAWEAGLLLFWITPDEVIVVAREELGAAVPSPLEDTSNA